MINTSLKITTPQRISFDTWSSQIRDDLPHIDFPVSSSFKHWREWAAQVVVSNSLFSCPVPTKLGFPEINDWRQWAARFINSVTT